jgi:DNA-binding FadR family transcriptional regulator
MNQETDQPAGSPQRRRRPTTVAGERTSQAIFAPIEPPTVFAKAVERLARAIALGLLLPGEQLPTERELALQLDISRPTLRQALVVLQQSGYLESRRGRAGGTWVVDRAASGATAALPLAADWSDSLDFRLAIEAGCAMLASTRATAAGLDALQELVVQMDAARTYEEFRRSDIRFHLGIAECTGNRRLIDAMAEAQELMTQLFERMVERPQMVWATSNRQHEKMVLALRGHDAQTAARIAWEHVESSRHILSGLTSS